MTNTEHPLMLDDSHIVSNIVFESEPNVFHVALDAFSDYDDFPDVINTTYGNENLFYIHKVVYNEHAEEYTAFYKQNNSDAMLIVYKD